MPSGAFVLKRLAEQGLDEAFLDGNLRFLRAAGFLPVGRKGGGKAVLHWQAIEYARYIIALAAAGPTSAAATVDAIASLPFSGFSVDTGEGTLREPIELPPIGMGLADYLAQEIERTAAAIKTPRKDAEEAAAAAVTAAAAIVPAITIWLDPDRVEIAFYDERGHALLATFQAPAPDPLPGQNALMALYTPRPRLWVQRVARIPYEIIAACAELLAMNPIVTSAHPSKGETPPSGSRVGGPSNENAPDPARSEASIRNSQPLAKATETSLASEVREDGNAHQVPFGDHGWLTLQSSKDQSSHALHLA